MAQGGRGTHRGTHNKKSKSSKAGLTFPVGRVCKNLRRLKVTKRIAAGAPIYLAAVLEYVTAEILELAGNSARDNKFKRVRPRDITLAVRNDEELSKFIGKDTVIPGGGVVPSIHKSLIKKKATKKVKSEPTMMDEDEETKQVEEDAEEAAEGAAEEAVEGAAEEAGVEATEQPNEATAAQNEHALDMKKSTKPRGRPPKKNLSTSKTNAEDPNTGGESMRMMNDDDDDDE